ncbi:unnamed protein product [Vicia faba]|uniref:Uncharacterized protein n=1 Tax=Vicia faba TaxID=3906 RepID=A0AAV0YSB7_VICFA|nr:unnamed protein product [Vicia faba]
MGLQGPDIEKIVHFLSICILAFINEGSSSLSSNFINSQWSWGLSIPISLYFKFALEFHAHLGICVGIGVPSLVYWGVTRAPIDWYLGTVIHFNVEIMKTGLFNIVIGLLHLFVSKLIHRLIEWINDRKIKVKRLSFLFPAMNYENEKSNFSGPSLIGPFTTNEILIKLVEALVSLFFNGNVLLLSWCFSGQIYTHEVTTSDEKVYKVEKNQICSIDDKKGSKDQELVICSLEC